MEYEITIGETTSTIDGGSGILLLHPSTAETDQVDTDFLKSGADSILIISTRTTAREVQQKLEYYGVDEEKAVIIDTLSIERGYTRRSADNIHYVSAPDDLDGIVDQVENFFSNTAGKRRISVDSLTEMAYYADEEQAHETANHILSIIEQNDAIGLFHLSPEVHDETVVDSFAAYFEGVITISPDGEISQQLS